MQHAAINMLNFALFNGGTFGLQPYVLQKIFVNDNDLGARGAEEIAEALATNTTLTVLDVKVNRIGDRGQRKLQKAVEGRTVFTLLSDTTMA